MFPFSKKLLFFMFFVFLIIVTGVFLYVQYLYIKAEPEGLETFKVEGGES